MFRGKQYRQRRTERQNYVKQKCKTLKASLKTSSNNVDYKKVVQKSLPHIISQLKDGTLTSQEVLKAFQQQALDVHECTNCLVEPLSEQEINSSGTKTDGRGLLAGIPVSIKDDIGIKGFVSTTGASKFLEEICQEDSVLVKVLKKQGAVIFARTNEPQLGLSAEAGNPIYGPVWNPHGVNRNPGGSSSGEGALVGGGGSLLGFGSDIGGSVRIPAHNCGCCAFKPTSERVSHKGMKVLGMGESAVPVTWGPLARDVDSIVLAMRALWDGSMTEFDPLCPPLKFQTELFEDTRPLKIGYFKDNKFFAPTPVCCRAVDMAVEELRRQGHEVIEWCPPEVDNVDILESTVIMADGGAEIVNIMVGDEVDDTMKTLMMALKAPNIIKPLLPALARWTMSDKDGKLAETFNGCKNVAEYWNLQKKVKDYQNKVTEEWQKLALDAVISPPLPYPALPTGNADLSVRGAGYMMIYNVLNFPAGVVRMTKQNEEDIKKLGNYEIRDKHHKEVKQLIQDGVGLPVGVMVAALRWQDEKCLRIMKLVEKAADFKVKILNNDKISETNDECKIEITEDKTQEPPKQFVYAQQIDVQI